MDRARPLNTHDAEQFRWVTSIQDPRYDLPLARDVNPQRAAWLETSATYAAQQRRHGPQLSQTHRQNLTRPSKAALDGRVEL
jgi:hypothetical protein